MDIRTFLSEFETWIQQNGPEVMPSSARKYKKEAQRFVKSVGLPFHVGAQQLVSWRDSMIAGGLAATTINTRLAAVMALYSFCCETKNLQGNPAVGLKMRVVPKRKPRPVEEFDIVSILEYLRAQPESLETLQDLAIFETLYGSGVRRQELGKLTFNSIKNKDELRVIGKGDKERITTITDAQYEAIRDWCVRAYGDAKTKKLERDVSIDAAFTDLRKRFPDHGIFKSTDYLKNHADPGQVIYQRVRHYAEILGIKMAPHNWRHSFGTGLINSGVDIAVVKELMGHETFHMVMNYASIGTKAIKRAKNQHPRNTQ